MTLLLANLRKCSFQLKTSKPRTGKVQTLGHGVDLLNLVNILEAILKIALVH